jgi:glycosyltransferase involved in cell wall biosynthesis
MSQSTEKLDWGLVISTYKREAILPRCLHLAAQQTLAPKEIIVVDASPYWEKTRNQIMQELAAKYPTIDWKYVQAKRASLPTQRNQGIEFATSDILFLIDDDSLMYPDCAEEVMRIYAQDTAHKVVGIMCSQEAFPPDEQQGQTDKKRSLKLSDKLKNMRRKLRSFVLDRLDRLTNTKHIFFPYDFSFPKQIVPEALKSMAICPVHLMPGAYMTFRRDVFNEIRFEETLMRYAPHEDFDVCCRVFRLGIILHALNARLCHLEASGGRVTRYTRAVLWGLNLAVLHRLHSPDFVRYKKCVVNLFWRTLINRTIKDVLSFYWTLPSTRGFLFAFRYYQKIFLMTPEELRTWYPQFQQQTLFSQNQ